MNKSTVWKFKVRNDASVEMPDGAQILYVKAKDSGIYIWALVNPNAHMKTIRLKIVESGELFEENDNLHYIGTVTRNSGYRVHHIFKLNS